MNKYFFICIAILLVPAMAGDLPSRITGETPQSYSERLQAVRSLNAPLSPHWETRLLEYLASAYADSPGQASGREAAVRNDLLDRLRVIGVPPDRIAASLTEALASPETPDRWRDFCVQHLGQLYSNLNPPVQAPVRAALLEASQHKQDALAGTALLALRNALPAEELSTHILRIGLDSAYSEASRTTALHLAAELPPDPRLLDTARDLLTYTPERPRASLPLRLAALKLLGEAGEPSDFARLAAYHSNPLPPLQLAAHRATRALEQRHPSER